MWENTFDIKRRTYICSPSASLMDPISSCCGVFPWLT